MTQLERLREHIRTVGTSSAFGQTLLIGGQSHLQIGALNHVYYIEKLGEFWNSVIVTQQSAQEWLEFFGINTETVEA